MIQTATLSSFGKTFRVIMESVEQKGRKINLDGICWLKNKWINAILLTCNNLFQFSLYLRNLIHLVSGWSLCLQRTHCFVSLTSISGLMSNKKLLHSNSYLFMWNLPSLSQMQNYLMRLIKTTFECSHLKHWSFPGGEFNPCIRKTPEKGNGNSLQYSCLGNPLDRGAWRTTVHGVAKELHMT